MPTNSLLKEARLNRGWNRSQVIIKVENHFSLPSLERWEAGDARHMREDNVAVLCQLYGMTPEALGLGENHVIMGVENVPIIQEENPIMSDFIRRFALSDLGGYLTSLVSTWPRRNHHYEELQEGVNKAVTLHSTLVGQDDISVMNRRQALMSLALVPIHLVGVDRPKKADTEALLTHCAAGITACWYLRRGKDLAFVSDLTQSYTSILEPLAYSQSDAYRRSSATLLSQSFRLRGSITEQLKNSAPTATSYYHKALRYGLMAENKTEQAIANRMMAFLHWRQGPLEYEQALLDAEKAHGLMTKDTPKIIRSFMASGLSLCQAAYGKTDDAKMSIAEAHDLFDITDPIPFAHYTESNLLAIEADVNQRSGLWRESVNLLKESLSTPDISALGSVQAHIQYAKTEVSRDDQPRNMDLCIKLLTEGITGANELGSERSKQEARECYGMLRLAWPRENVVKTLGRDHFGM